MHKVHKTTDYLNQTIAIKIANQLIADEIIHKVYKYYSKVIINCIYA